MDNVKWTMNTYVKIHQATLHYQLFILHYSLKNYWPV